MKVMNKRCETCFIKADDINAECSVMASELLGSVGACFGWVKDKADYDTRERAIKIYTELQAEKRENKRNREVKK